MLLSELLASHPLITLPHNNTLAREQYFFNTHLEPNIILTIPAAWLEPDYQDEGLKLISLGLIMADPPLESSETRQFWQSKKHRELFLSLPYQHIQFYWPSSELYRLGSAILSVYTKI